MFAGFSKRHFIWRFALEQTLDSIGRPDFFPDFHFALYLIPFDQGQIYPGLYGRLLQAAGCFDPGERRGTE